MSQEYLSKKHSGACEKNSKSGFISKERKLRSRAKKTQPEGSPSNENVSSLILFLSGTCSTPLCLLGHNIPEAQPKKSSKDTQFCKPCCPLSQDILFHLMEHPLSSLHGCPHLFFCSLATHPDPFLCPTFPGLSELVSCQLHLPKHRYTPVQCP